MRSLKLRVRVGSGRKKDERILEKPIF